MKVLVAASQTDPRDRGFAFTVPGELLTMPMTCDKPGCGCRWSFAGLSSDKGTTLAEVADWPNLDQNAYANLGGDPTLAEAAASFEPGTLLVGWFPRDSDPEIVPLDEWVGRHGLHTEPQRGSE